MMIQADQKVEINISASRRRELVALLCVALDDALSRHDNWETGCELCHWQATVPAFELLPATIIETIFNEWSDSGERMDEIEFSGYLETDDGPRAWGFLALRKDQPRLEERPLLENLQLFEQDGLYQLKATIQRTITGEQTGLHD